MIGTQHKTKRFSLGTFFLMLFLALSVHTYFDIDTVYAQAKSSSEVKAAAPAGVPPAKTPTTSPTKEKDASCWISPMCVAKGALYGIFSLFAFLASLAAAIFSYVLDVSHFQAIMDNAVIYEMWRIVRDFFNLFFIFALLIVAFTTIFQVEKFGGLKSVWSIVLAALFINFSFPLARMIIDLGNVAMYSFITDIFGMTGQSLTNGILSTSGIKGLFLPGGFDDSLEFKFYFIAIICMFMFGVSFLILALMMFYRLFMLPILVMFSPIGFAGSAIPGMGGFSKQWWDKLIKNVFYGPIAVFMVMIAVKFLEVLISSNIAKNSTIGRDTIVSAATSGDLIASIVYMTIPIMFFWIAITSAESLSSQASGMANKFGSNFLKKMGAKYSGWNAAKRFGSAYSAERKKREDHKLQNGWMTSGGKLFGQKQNKWTDQAHGAVRRGDKWYAGMPGSAAARERLDTLYSKEIAEKAKEYKEGYADEATLMKKIKSGSNVEKAAAAIALSEGKKIDGAKNFVDVLAAAGNDPGRVESILEKIGGTGALRDMGDTEYRAIMENIENQFKGKPELIKSMKAKFDGQMKKDGHGQVLVNSLVGQVNSDTGDIYNHASAYQKTMGKMSVEELGKQKIKEVDANFKEFVVTRSIKTRNSIQTNDKVAEDIKVAWGTVETPLDTAPKDAAEASKKSNDIREKLKAAKQRSGR